MGEKSELGGGDKSEGVIVPPKDLLTDPEVDEIVHSKHSFGRKCLLKNWKKCCGTHPISTTISGFSLRKEKLEKYAGFWQKKAKEFGKNPKPNQNPETPNCFGLWSKCFQFLIARNQTFFSFCLLNENP